MIGRKVILIRLGVLVVMISATFALGWYLTTRFMQLTEDGRFISLKEEINNPRLDRVMLERITGEFERRDLYSVGDEVGVVVPENDPFYE